MDNKKENTAASSEPKKLYRLPNKGMIAGVAAGLSDYFGLDVTLMRILFIISIFVTNGVVIIIYFIAALLVPTPEEEAINADNLERKINNFTKDIGSSVGSSQSRNWIGIALILFGGWLLARSVLPGLMDIEWSVIVPVLLIIVGLLFIVRGKK